MSVESARESRLGKREDGECLCCLKRAAPNRAHCKKHLAMRRKYAAERRKRLKEKSR